jgi:hypothetical protein
VHAMLLVRGGVNRRNTILHFLIFSQ